MNTIIKLVGVHGGELDRVVIREDDATVERIQRAVQQIALRCVLHVGDTITITEED